MQLLKSTFLVLLTLTQNLSFTPTPSNDATLKQESPSPEKPKPSKTGTVVKYAVGALGVALLSNFLVARYRISIKGEWRPAPGPKARVYLQERNITALGKLQNTKYHISGLSLLFQELSSSKTIEFMLPRCLYTPNNWHPEILTELKELREKYPQATIIIKNMGYDWQTTVYSMPTNNAD